MTQEIDGLDYGPLQQLLGRWIGTKGLDNAPDANANPDKTAFTDELVFTIAGPAENAEEQQLVAIKYHHTVRKLENGKIFHDQIGHWIYEASTGIVMHSLTIPRGVCVLAGGTVTQNSDETIFVVKAEAGAKTFGIIQSPFMFEKAKTNEFQMKLSVKGDAINYEETMSLFIYGKDFEHTDKSSLKRVVYD
ncbi:MAG: heme-binding beta-barrel domain-containing protein [Kangiellaceae bacterium]|nr:heme-binding beta-barrel domain-containing protein [Kangiellaceae bacterium]